jgi:DNA-binding NarL/FixJ family response regulator
MRALLAIADLMARSRLQQAAKAAGYEVSSARGVPDPADDPPDVLVVDLDQPATLDALAAWRAAHPDVRVVGFAFHAHEDVMAAARSLGAEVVTHGTTGRPERIFPVSNGPAVS